VYLFSPSLSREATLNCKYGNGHLHHTAFEVRQPADLGLSVFLINTKLHITKAKVWEVEEG